MRKSIVLVSLMHAIRNHVTPSCGWTRARFVPSDPLEKWLKSTWTSIMKWPEWTVVPGLAWPQKEDGAISGSSSDLLGRREGRSDIQALLEACSLPNVQQIWAEQVQAETYEEYDGENAVVIGSGEVRVLRVQLLDGQGHARERFKSGESMVVAVTFRTTEPVERPVMGVAIHRNDGVYVYGPNNRFDEVLDGVYDGIYTYFIHYPSMPLLAGSYRVSVAVFDKHHLKPHVWHNQLYDFEVAQDIEDHGLVRIDHAWGLLTHVEGEHACVQEDSEDKG